MASSEFERLLTDSHNGNDQKSDRQAFDTPLQPSACAAEREPEGFLCPMGSWIAVTNRRRQSDDISRPPENLKNLPPLFIGKTSLTA
ncbi:hypothetical protein [Rhizobium leguminosarum]|uniref:hypothetical protein n=1 Tax=Rhizobium leguminosarum TaxID=384 RepID=UPI003F982844